MTPSSRTWLAIPAVGLACAGLAALAGLSAQVAVATGLAAGALAAAVRAYAGASLPAALAASAAGALGALGMLELHGGRVVHGALAAAVAAFAIAELARETPAAPSPWPALAAAAAAAVLDPAYLLLVPLSGARLVSGPWRRPRLAIAILLGGVLGCLLGVAAALAHGGALATLWTMWAGHPRAAAAPAHALALAGDAIGPLVLVAALAGLATAAGRGRYAAGALGALVLGALALDLRAGAVTFATPIAAALAAGLGLARLAAMVRHPAGQACLGAAAGFVLVVAPAWTLAAG